MQPQDVDFLKQAVELPLRRRKRRKAVIVVLLGFLFHAGLDGGCRTVDGALRQSLLQLAAACPVLGDELIQPLLELQEFDVLIAV